MDTKMLVVSYFPHCLLFHASSCVPRGLPHTHTRARLLQQEVSLIHMET